jgi:hypothetical protein
MCSSAIFVYPFFEVYFCKKYTAPAREAKCVKDTP